ncbi:MAG: hypothetical protein C4530_13585 [Desulfobacteraceae bacterium]|nr:MAG: hypothetical protein C4530_13585 [Desulfobacteraceae bacterium]
MRHDDPLQSMIFENSDRCNLFFNRLYPALKSPADAEKSVLPDRTPDGPENSKERKRAFLMLR